MIIRAALIAIAIVGLTVQEGRTDEDLVDDVETIIRLKGGLPVNGIEIESKSGVVTLTGSVRHLIQRDRAAALARLVRGVRSVVNRIRVDTDRVPDEELMEDVRVALKQYPVTRDRKVLAEAKDGVVRLTGTTETGWERELAEEVVKRIEGITAIRNEIIVKGRPARSNRDLATGIRRMLRWDSLLDDGEIKVSVIDGVARLTGRVGSAVERRRAMWDAWKVGVKGVDARDLYVETRIDRRLLRRKKYEGVSDPEALKAVLEAIRIDPRVKGYDIRVSVEERVATLEGQVGSLSAKWAAGEDAVNTIGVRAVKNQIDVRSAQPGKDLDLRRTILKILQKSSIIRQEELDVEVRRGVVILRGETRSEFERRHASRLIGRVDGVAEVRNHIDSRSERNSWPTKSDFDIRDDLIRLLRLHPWLNPDLMKIRVRDGVATVTGTVDTSHDRRAVALAARQAGASSVENRLEVRFD